MKLMSARGHFLGGDGQVAFVLTVFIVDNNQHAARTYLFERIGYGNKGHRSTG